MALDDILATIRAETDAEIATLRRAGRASREELLAHAREDAAAAEDAAASARDDAAALARDRIVNRALLLADRELRSAAEAVYREVRTAAETRLAAQRGTSAYEVLFEHLLEECLDVLPGARFLEVDPRDAELASRLLEQHRIHNLQIETTLETSGGLAVATGDGRRADNTLESRLGRGEAYLRQLVTSMIPILRERTT